MQEQSISRVESVFLFLNATSYKLSKDMPKISEPATDYYYKTSYWFACIIEFGIADVITNYLKLNSTPLLVFILLCMVLHVVVAYVYNKKIEIIAENYYVYYNRYFYAAFILLLIAGFAYIFNSLIGTGYVDPRYR